MSQKPHDPTTAATSALDESESAEAFAEFVGLLEPEPPGEGARARLLAALRPEGRFDRFAADVARLLDVPEDEARRVLDAAGRVDAYEPGPFPDVALYHVQGGASVAGAITGFVRITGGACFPTHEHLGEETVLILQGSMLEPESGRVARSGELVLARAGELHTTIARPGPDLVFLTVLFEGLRIGATELRADDPRL